MSNIMTAPTEELLDLAVEKLLQFKAPAFPTRKECVCGLYIHREAIREHASTCVELLNFAQQMLNNRAAQKEATRPKVLTIKVSSMDIMYALREAGIIPDKDAAELQRINTEALSVLHEDNEEITLDAFAAALREYYGDVELDALVRERLKDTVLSVMVVHV